MFFVEMLHVGKKFFFEFMMFFARLFSFSYLPISCKETGSILVPPVILFLYEGHDVYMLWFSWLQD